MPPKGKITRVLMSEFTISAAKILYKILYKLWYFQSESSTINM